MSIKDRVKTLLQKIGKTTDLTVDLEKNINKIKVTTSMDSYKKANWLELMKISKDMNLQNNNFLHDLTLDLSDAKPEKERIETYNNIRALKKRVPILGRAIRVFVDNILSPDDITKRALQIILSDDAATEQDEASFTPIKENYKTIIKKFNLEQDADTIIFDTMLDGDKFIEIVLSEENVRTTIERLGVKLKDNEEFNIEYEIINELHKPYKQLTESDSEFILLTEDEVTDSKPKLSASDIYLLKHNPKNVIVLQHKKMIYGYLILEGEESNYNMTAARSKYPEEDRYNKEFIDKVYRNIYNYLQKEKSIKSIPRELYSTLSNILKANDITGIRVRYVPIHLMEHFKMPSDEMFPYGESYASDLIFVLKLYFARMTSDTIAKLARAGKHLAFYINIDGTRDVKKRIEEVKRSVRKREFTTDDFKSVDLIPSTVSTMEDFFIPVQDGKRLIEIEPIDIDTTTDNTEANKGLLKDILTGFEIPPSYLGIEEFNSTKATLSQESEVFARSIIRLQKIFTNHFTSLARKIYMLLHNTDATLDESLLDDIFVTFTPPRGIIAETFGNIYQQIHNIFDDLKAMGVPEDYIRKKFLPEIEWEEIAIEELKNIKDNNKDKENEDTGFDFGGEGEL